MAELLVHAVNERLQQSLVLKRFGGRAKSVALLQQGLRWDATQGRHRASKQVRRERHRCLPCSSDRKHEEPDLVEQPVRERGDGIFVEGVDDTVVVMKVPKSPDLQILVVESRREADLHARGRGVGRRVRLDLVGLRAPPLRHAPPIPNQSWWSSGSSGENSPTVATRRKRVASAGVLPKKLCAPERKGERIEDRALPGAVRPDERRMLAEGDLGLPNPAKPFDLKRQYSHCARLVPPRWFMTRLQPAG